MFSLEKEVARTLRGSACGRFSFRCGLVLLMLLSAPVFAQPPSPGRNSVAIRGQTQDVYFYPATGGSSGPLKRILFAPGDGGWRGWAVTIAQTMSAWGYDVYGLDTKRYLTSFTGKTTLSEADVMNDFRQLAEWMTGRSGERVILVGWSEGAGLALLAAASTENKKTFSGVITFGLAEAGVLGWRWIDDLTYITKRPPKEPRFQTAKFVAQVAPLPLVMLHSSRDEDVSVDVARQLFWLARDPKQLAIIDAKNHRFDGNQDEFFRRLREGVQWITQASR